MKTLLDAAMSEYPGRTAQITAGAAAEICAMIETAN